jgi:excisionase family DNA binding protein
MAEVRRYLSTTQIAEALGLSTTTVKRWVDGGILPAHKTAGGHRKILVGDVLRLIRREHWPHLDLSKLTGGVPPESVEDLPRLAGQFFEALCGDDVQAAATLLDRVYQAGVGMDQLADEVVAPAMHRVGDQWQEGACDVSHEHRATQVCLESVLQLRQHLPTHSDTDRPLAVGGAPEGDHYLVPSLLVQMVLLDHGWRAINIGPNTPLASFSLAMKEFQPRLLWFSCSYLACPEAWLAAYRRFHREAKRAGVTVVLGGQALTPELCKNLPGVNFGDGLAPLATFLRSFELDKAR